MLENIKNNWKSGLTVALVSIPMSVSLGVASGATPTAGILTAIWAGLMAAIFGGSAFNIVGPAGALSGILAGFALTHGAALLPMLAIITGVFVFISYLLRLERYLIYIPASTVHGFTLGVGLILALSQLNSALGLSGLTAHSEFIENVKESIFHIGSTHAPTILLFLAFLAFLFTILKFAPKIPGVILLSPIAILIGYFSANGKIPFELATLGSKFPDIKATFFIPHPFLFDSSLIVPALTVAAVAVLETMLCAKIADGMAGTKYNKRKEMLALSIANVVSGSAGGLPATAVLARTALNVKTGAKSKMSQGFNAVCVGIISFVFLSYFKFIPMSAVAAILVFTSYRMIEQHHFARMFKQDKKAFWISIAVAGVTIWYDPMYGILFGTAISLLLFVEKMSKGQFDLVVNDINKKIVEKVSGEKIKELPANCDTLVYTIHGPLAYMNAQAHLSRFEEVKTDYKNIVLRLRPLHFIDLDGVDALDEIISILQKRNINVFVSGVNPFIEANIRESKYFNQLRANGKVFEKTSHALATLGY